MWFNGIHLNISFVHFALFKKKNQIYLQTSALNWFLTFLTLSLGFQTPGPVARSGPRTLSLLARDEMSKISLNLRYVFLFNYWKALIIPLRIKNRIFTLLFHRRISPVYDVIDLQRFGVTSPSCCCMLFGFPDVEVRDVLTGILSFGVCCWLLKIISRNVWLFHFLVFSSCSFFWRWWIWWRPSWGRRKHAGLSGPCGDIRKARNL